VSLEASERTIVQLGMYFLFSSYLNMCCLIKKLIICISLQVFIEGKNVMEDEASRRLEELENTF
jgi:hypothetical protein